MQEKRTTVRRWLLPFTRDVDMPALATALHLAEVSDATLVALSLIVVPEGRRVRLEWIQQSKDFLEALRYKAQRLHVPFESHEVYTSNPPEQIATLTRELACDGLILMSKGKQTLLLRPPEALPLLLHPPTSLVLVRLPIRSLRRFHTWFGRRRQSEEGKLPYEEYVRPGFSHERNGKVLHSR